MFSSELRTGSNGVRNPAPMAANAMTTTTSAPAVPSGCRRTRLQSRAPSGFFRSSSSLVSMKACGVAMAFS